MIDSLTALEQRKLAAWEKAFPIPRQDPNTYRWDCDDRIICWAEYGELSLNGWEIDHITPTACGGADTLNNIRARHWLGNRSAGGVISSILTGVGGAGN